MKTRALNENGDIYLSKNQSAFVEDVEATAQMCQSRLRFYRNEWALDRNAGVPYFQEIFVQPLNLPHIESVLKTVILQSKWAVLDIDNEPVIGDDGLPVEEGINRLLSFSLESDSGGRDFFVQFSADTTYGIIISETFTINSNGTVTVKGA